MSLILQVFFEKGILTKAVDISMQDERYRQPQQGSCGNIDRKMNT
jgi:hypothetical protein